MSTNTNVIYPGETKEKTNILNFKLRDSLNKIKNKLLGGLSEKDILKAGGITLATLTAIFTILGIKDGGKEDTATQGSTNTDFTTTPTKVQVNVPDRTTKTSQDLVTDIDKTNTQQDSKESSTTGNEGTTGDDSVPNLSEYIKYASETDVSQEGFSRKPIEGEDYDYFGENSDGIEIYNGTGLAAVEILSQLSTNKKIKKVNLADGTLTVEALELIHKLYPKCKEIYATFKENNPKVNTLLNEYKIQRQNTNYLTYLQKTQTEQENNLYNTLKSLQWGGKNHEIMLKNSPITQQQNETQLSYNSKMPHNNKTQQGHKKTQYYRKVA